MGDNANIAFPTDLESVKKYVANGFDVNQEIESPDPSNIKTNVENRFFIFL